MHLINKKSLWLLIKLKFLNELSTFQWDRSFNECSFFIEKYAGAPKWEKVHSYTTPVLEWTYKLLQYQSTVWFEYDAWILFCMDISNYRRDKQNYFYVEVTAEFVIMSPSWKKTTYITKYYECNLIIIVDKKFIFLYSLKFPLQFESLSKIK